MKPQVQLSQLVGGGLDYPGPVTNPRACRVYWLNEFSVPKGFK
jgi:hypothetical protein